MSSDPQPGAVALRASQRLVQLERTIRAEFAEMPAMRLTDRQIQKLWDLSPAEADIVLRHLMAAGHLCRLASGLVARAGASDGPDRA
jgi:hypothetical protein